MYELASINAALTGTIFAGRLHFSPTTGSTNSDAMAAARNGAPHGSVFFADEQTELIVLVGEQAQQISAHRASTTIDSSYTSAVPVVYG